MLKELTETGRKELSRNDASSISQVYYCHQGLFRSLFGELDMENEMKLYLLSCFEFITPLFEKLYIVYHCSQKPK